MGLSMARECCRGGFSREGLGAVALAETASGKVAEAFAKVSASSYKRAETGRCRAFATSVGFVLETSNVPAKRWRTGPQPWPGILDWTGPSRFSCRGLSDIRVRSASSLRFSAASREFFASFLA